MLVRSTIQLIASILISSYSGILLAQGNSVRFDIESTIISNSKVATLDKSLNADYSLTMKNSAIAHVIRISQRNWLNNYRNRCNSEAELINAYTNRIQWLHGVNRRKWKKITHSKMKISFIIPVDWKYTLIDDRKIVINSKYVTTDDSIDAAMYMRMSAEDLDSVLHTSEYFASEGRDDRRLSPIKGSDWHGLIGNYDYFTSNPNGGRSAAWRTAAFVTNGERTLSVDVEANIYSEFLDIIVSSLRFFR